jgi:hypothetical protein
MPSRWGGGEAEFMTYWWDELKYTCIPLQF